MKSKFRLLVLVALLAHALMAIHVAAYEPEAVQEPVTYDPESVPVHPTLLSTYKALFPPAVIQVTEGVYVARDYNRNKRRRKT